MSNISPKEEIIHADFCLYKNQIAYVDKLITIYSIIKMDKDSQLRNFEKDVLNYYLRFGYSTDTKKKIREIEKKSLDTITQATFYLKKKGYLIQSKTNFSQKSFQNCDLLELYSDYNKEQLKKIEGGPWKLFINNDNEFTHCETDDVDFVEDTNEAYKDLISNEISRTNMIRIKEDDEEINIDDI